MLLRLFVSAYIVFDFQRYVKHKNSVLAIHKERVDNKDVVGERKCAGVGHETPCNFIILL
jgi:hypothetical protein